MTKLVPLKSKQVVRKLELLGFEKVRHKGSHAQYKHPNGQQTTIPVHPTEQIGRGLLRKIIRDIDLTVEEWQKIKKWANKRYWGFRYS